MAVDGGGGGPVMSARVKKTIQSIKEIVGGHSDDEIYAALKESGMDPNETAQTLLNQDPFHEVKRKRDKKRENGGQRSSADAREQVEHSAQWTKPRVQWVRNDDRRVYSRNQSADAGPSREFRIVRDNRFQHDAMDSRPEPAWHISGSGQTVSDASEKCVTVVQFDQKHFPVTSSKGYHMPQGVKNNSSSELLQAKRVVQGSPQKHSKSYLKHSLNGRHFSTTNPVHVPSPNSSVAGTAGAIHHQVGVVNVPRQPSDQSGLQSSALSSAFHPKQRGNSTSVGPSGRQSALMSKSIQSNQRSALEPAVHGRSNGGSSFIAQNINKFHQGPAGNQKAMLNMEWKPKSIKKPATGDLDASGRTEISPSDHSGNSNVIDIASLADKISQANILEDDHVIIPEHLRVPESEQTRLRFGSFTSGLDSNHGQVSASPESGNPKHAPEAVPLASTEFISSAEHDEAGEQPRSLQHDLSTSAAELSQTESEDSEHLNCPGVENDNDIALVQSNAPLPSPAKGQNIQTTSSLPVFSAYDLENPEANNDAPLYRLVEANVHSEVLPSQSEAYPSGSLETDNDVQMFGIVEPTVHSQALSSQVASSSPVVISAQQQQLAQPQPAAQLYSQVQMSHFPNFVPYRHVYSPVYVPPMAMPNYSTNIAYPHPLNGNNYLQMPGGSSHITAGGMKYGVSQYKSVPAGNSSGYGNYTHPAGFTISSPGVIGGAVGLEDVNRMKYKDSSNLYVSNPQVETSDIWIQTPRDIPTLQSPSYYNLPGQPGAAAFVPNAGNASFNATAQSSHSQFLGLYHPQQPASIVSPHHMVHQQVPSALGGSVGVGVAAPGPQVGAYQQPQLGHLNWRANF